MKNKKDFKLLKNICYGYGLHPLHNVYFHIWFFLGNISDKHPTSVFHTIYELLYKLAFKLWEKLTTAWLLKYLRYYLNEMIPRDFRLQRSLHDDFKDLTPMSQRIYKIHFMYAFINSFNEEEPDHGRTC